MQSAHGPRSGLVWYVSYGSNMSAARLACYLEGGCPPGGRRTYVGAKDSSAPQAIMPLTLPGTVFFAGESLTWGGGRAFYDPEVPGHTPARAYLLTEEQFEDVRAQEPPVYDRLLEIGVHAGVRMLTFTSRLGRSAVAPVPPSAAYMAMIGEGIREAHGWTNRQVAQYVERLTGG